MGIGDADSRALPRVSRYCGRGRFWQRRTTAIAGMTTFALGAYALMGDMRVAAAGGVVTAGLLAGRENLHGIEIDAEIAEENEFRAGQAGDRRSAVLQRGLS